ncbi:MAG: hypothetical protein R6W06_03485 [Prochlorococcaceae cyanobacterium]
MITRIATLSDAFGCLGFYEHLIPEFQHSPTDPLHLLLLLKDIRRTLGTAPSGSAPVPRC